MIKPVITTIFSFIIISAFGKTPEETVSEFGNLLSTWCETGKISYREQIEELCSGTKKCRVEDKMHADYQNAKGLSGYDTFVLDNFLNMFQDVIKSGQTYKISNVKLETQDKMPEGEVLSFISANVSVSGSLNYEVSDLFLVRDDKISGIYNFSSQLGFSHLNGSLVEALKIGRYKSSSGFIDGYAIVTNEIGLQGLIDVKGNVVIPCIWDKMEYSGGEFVKAYNYKTNNESGTYDLRYEGKQIPIYYVIPYRLGRDSKITYFSDGYAVVKNEYGKYGFLKEDDNEYNVDFKYDYATIFSEGYALADYLESQFFIDSNLMIVERKINREKYAIIDGYHDGLAKIKDLNTGLYGFIDKKQKIVIPCEFEGISSFSEGIAVAEKGNISDDERVAMVDIKGNLITPYSFKSNWGSFKNGYIELNKDINGKIKGSLLNKKGELLPGFGWQYDGVRRFFDGLARYEIDGKYGYLNELGDEVIPAQYEYAEFFNNGYACVGNKIDGKRKYGCINTDGTMVIPLIYDDVFSFDNGIALVKQDGRVGLIDVYGNSTFFDKE